MTVFVHSTDAPQHAPQDITSEEVGLWVAEEFFAIKDDLFEVRERIGRERSVIAQNEYRSKDFPMTHFAHQALLQQLEARFSVLLKEAVVHDRTLH